MGHRLRRYPFGMAAKVEVTFSHPHGKHEVGDTTELPKLEAKNLVRAGIATYSTVPAAKAAEGDRGAAKSGAAVKKQA